MNELQVFNSPEFGEIRAVEIDGEPWFVGKDVAAGLGYKDTVNALKAHVDNEDKKGGWRITTPSGEQEMTLINESGVYSLIFSSKLESAKKFKRWVTAEVLPSIRKRGGYMTPEAERQLTEGLTAMAATVQSIAKGYEAQTVITQNLTNLVESLTRRVDNLEQDRGPGRMKTLPPGPERTPFDDDNPFADVQPRPASLLARKLWMRLAGEKLDLLSQRYGKSNNAVLHRIYQDMEEHFETVMDEERSRVMEEQGLEKCSVLLAIFFDAELRDYFQRYVDYNLAPENRGW